MRRMHSFGIDYTVEFTSVRWHTACALLPAGSGMLRREGRKHYDLLTFAVMGRAMRDSSVHDDVGDSIGDWRARLALINPKRISTRCAAHLPNIPPPTTRTICI